MRKLIKKILRESDDMEWIRDITPYIPFEDATIGETYRVEFKNWTRFEEMLDMCGEYGEGDANTDYIAYVSVYDKSELFCEDIYCEVCDYWVGKELCLGINFLNSDKESTLTLWVSRDLIQLYAI